MIVEAKVVKEIPDSEFAKIGNVFACKNGLIYRDKSGVLVPYSDRERSGYKVVSFNGKTHTVHSLIAEAFLGPKPSPKHVVDHIDGNKNNNRLDNLQYISWRDNITKGKLCKGKRFVGITKVSQNRWSARIHVNGKSIHIGCYPSATEAGMAYLKKKAELTGSEL